MRRQTMHGPQGGLRRVNAVVLQILQVALLVFIAGGVIAIAAVYMVRRRKVSYRHTIDPTLGTLGQMVVVPPTPLPASKTRSLIFESDR